MVARLVLELVDAVELEEASEPGELAFEPATFSFRPFRRIAVAELLGWVALLPVGSGPERLRAVFFIDDAPDDEATTQ